MAHWLLCAQMAARHPTTRKRMCGPGSRLSWTPQWKRWDAVEGSSQYCLRVERPSLLGSMGAGGGSGCIAGSFFEPLAYNCVYSSHSLRGNHPYRWRFFGVFAWQVGAG